MTNCTVTESKVTIKMINAVFSDSLHKATRHANLYKLHYHALKTALYSLPYLRYKCNRCTL